MPRKLRFLLIPLFFSLAALQGCNDDDEKYSEGIAGRSYVLGGLDGALATHLVQVFSPRPWNGETDGPVLMSANSLPGLSDSQKTALRAVIRGGHALLVTNIKHAHVQGIHTLTGSTPAISLDQMAVPYTTAEVYGLAEPGGRVRIFMAPPFAALPDPEPESSKELRATSAADWLLEGVRQVQTQATPSADGSRSLSASNLPWVFTIPHTMPAYWSTCGMNSPQMCVDNVNLNIGAWMVYSEGAATGQPSDFFIVQMSADLNTAGCKEFYSGRNHDNRLAAYWLRQVNMSASAPGFAYEDFFIPASKYAPPSSNPSTTNSTGVTWSLSGSGTVGVNAAQGAYGTLGFSAGVSYSDTRTATYQALLTKVNIAADAASPAAASWTYDSWNFVDNNIRPSNHACPNGLRKTEALPSIIYGGTFSPIQSWVWAAQPSVRTQLAGGVLPVNVDTSLLLGWAYYSTDKQCDGPSTTYGKYYIGTDSYHPYAPVVGASGSPSNGLNFDVSCGTHTILGSIPLGPYDEDDQKGSGNPGKPYAFPTWAVNIPFAPDPKQTTLSGISPTSGPPGTAVTLTGSVLKAAAAVNFGGTSITDLITYVPPKDNTNNDSLQVAAPSVPYGTKTVEVSVSNGTVFSQSFPFTYTQ